MKHKLPTILLVEDELEVRIELKKFLQRYSSEVYTASNGIEGLKVFREQKPSIVISDIKMPKMNGIEMAKDIKKNFPSQVIIFTTAHSDSKYFLEAIEMQVDGYILKPVDLGLLKNKINDIRKNMEIQRQNKLYENILNDIAQMQDSMIAVYDNDKVPVFYNLRLLTFLGYQTVESFIDEQYSLSSKFEANEDCYFPKKINNKMWVDEIKLIEFEKRIVSMRSKVTQELNFFLVSISEKTHSENTIITFSEVTSLVNKKRQYKSDAYTDELTQIYNRAKFNIVLKEVVEKSHRYKHELSIILIDIDNFKQVNDSFGHLKGDSVLKELTILIVGLINITNSFFRWGGEEFVLLVEDTTIHEAIKIAEKIRVLISKHDFKLNKQLTCSFGVSSLAEKDSPATLFKRVDQALYEAKNGGRNKVVFR